MNKNKRIIANYTNGQEGPLMIAFGGMHGNEPAGIMAIKLVQKMLEVEPITNPAFIFKGNFIGLIGNLKAYKQNKRFINRDLNRIWTKETKAKVQQLSFLDLSPEEQEIKEILEIINRTIEKYKPKKLIILDLHTTSSFGGIFSIASEDPESTKIALELHAPVIEGLLSGISGTTLHYFNEENLGLSTVAVTFESGQHEEKLSVNRAIAATINCMRTVGCVEHKHIENQHDSILIEYSKDLPKVSKLIHCHAIKEVDQFEMKPGYSNFQKVTKGEVLALDTDGDVEALDNARILMPLYQKQGEDGFFLIKEVEGY